MKRIKLFIGLTAAVCCLASTSQATFLAPGGFVFGDVQAGVGGTAASPLLASPYSDPTLVGTVFSQAFLSDPANPNGAGFLSFYYLVDNTGASVVSRFTTTGFGGVSTDSKQVVNGGKSPFTVDRSAGLGDGVNFNFNPGAGLAIPGGGFSQILIIHTDWTTWTYADASIIDSGRSDNFSVIAAVPEPTTVIAGALLLLPFGASTLRILRRNRTTV